LKDLMLSPALSQLLERARLRFGLEVEILDAGLNHLYPDSSTGLGRILQDSPAVRRSLLNAMTAGRPQDLEGEGVRYRVYPLRHSARRRQLARMLAIRRPPSTAPVPEDLEPWSELARAIVEADLAAVDTLGEERQRSRRFAGVLRFLEFVLETSDERALTDALVQAAAVWYDVDARIYRRSLAGDFVLHTFLPGAHATDSLGRLSAAQLGGDCEPRRLGSGELGDAAVGTEAVLVPLTAAPETEWVMALIGSVPPDADSVLRVLGRTAGMQLAALEARNEARMRQRFEQLLNVPTKAPELVALHLVRELAEAVGASAGSLTLHRNQQTRRIAAIGPAPDDRAIDATESSSSADRIVSVTSLGGADRAVLEFRAAVEFTTDSARVVQVCAEVMKVWIVGVLSSFDAAATLLDGRATTTSEFVKRIQEELERAKRFDLRLALILIDVRARPDVVADLQEALRRELRGSDVTGAMNASQVAALLTHTDATGLDNVVTRLRERLTAAAGRLNVSDLRLGRAAFSADTRTADDLVSEALFHAEPLIRH
jgi:hypothetical protein